LPKGPSRLDERVPMKVGTIQVNFSKNSQCQNSRISAIAIRGGYDPIWFGIIVTALCMLGIVAPPVAINFFVVKGLVAEEVSLNIIIKGILLFPIPLTLGVALLIAFPVISTFLPSFMTY
jgi:TRAP-type C4-dicarboxylate transport system permease large subunit